MNGLQSIKELWKKYSFILTPAQKRWGFLILIMTLIGAVFETLGVSIILPLVQIIISPEILFKNPHFAKLAEGLHISSREQIIWAVGLSVIAVYIIKNVFLVFLSYVRARYACKIQRELSVEIMKSYLGRGYPFFLISNTSELLRGMTGSIENTYNALCYILKIIAEILTAGCICVYFIVMDVGMALCVMLLAGACLGVMVIGFRGWMRECGSREYKYDALTKKILLQAFEGIKEVLVMKKERFFIKEYEETYIKRQFPAISKAVAQETPAYLIEGVCLTGLIVAVCFKALGADNADLLVAQLAAFAVGAFRILPSLGRISSSFNQVVFSTAGINDTYNNLKEVRKHDQSLKKELGNEKKEQKIIFQDRLEISGVVWQYENSEKKVLKDVSLSIKKGQAVALIGQSGAGKTTLADIILGLLRPSQGKVLLDGMYDIYDMPSEWSRIISFVPQSVYLVDDTIRNNIAFGVEKENIEDKKVWEALEQAQLSDFIKGLSEGLDTMIGERGVRFSGGQRQRVAIARALYSNPAILVLDEATSALDNETEEAVIQAIESLQGHKTLIIIAHRLSTVRNCDIIFEIKDGVAIQVEKEDIL